MHTGQVMAELLGDGLKDVEGMGCEEACFWLRPVEALEAELEKEPTNTTSSSDSGTMTTSELEGTLSLSVALSSTPRETRRLPGLRTTGESKKIRVHS